MYVRSARSAEYGSTGYGCHSCSWSAEEETCFFPCSRSRLRIWSHETGSAVPSRVSPLILHTQSECGVNSQDNSRFPLRRPCIPSTATGSVPSFSGHAIACRWCSLPKVCRRRASSPQGSSSNGCCLFRYNHGPILLLLLLLSSHLFWTSDLWTHKPGSHRISPPSFCVVTRIQLSLSLVDREVEFCVPTNRSFSTCWA